jgi:hypothetical protein
MARHNREASGADQRGFEYTISYQPDWLRQVKVSRLLGTGRQSTKTLFVNPEPPARAPGQLVRTGIRCEAQELGFELAVTDPRGVIRRVIVETAPPASGGVGPGGSDDASIQFIIESRS